MSPSERPMGMTIRVENVDDVVVIIASGETRGEPNNEIGETMQGVLDEGALRIVIDLSEAEDPDRLCLVDMMVAMTLGRDRGARIVGVPPVEVSDLEINQPLATERYARSRAQAIATLNEPGSWERPRVRRWWSRLLHK